MKAHMACFRRALGEDTSHLHSEVVLCTLCGSECVTRRGQGSCITLVERDHEICLPASEDDADYAE